MLSLALSLPFREQNDDCAEHAKEKAPSDEKEANNTASFFTDDAVKALWEVEATAQLYIDGKRAQMDLFENDEGDQQGGDTKSIA